MENPSQTPLQTPKRAPLNNDTERQRKRVRLASSLVVAVSTGNAPAAKHCLDALRKQGFERMGEGPEWRNSKRQTPLMIAAEKGHVENMQALWGWCDPEARDESECTALFLAIKNGRSACAEWMAAHPEARKDTVAERGRTLLHAAVESNDPRMAAWTASLPGVDVNACDDTGQSAFCVSLWSAVRCSAEIVSKIDPMAQNADGETAFIDAVDAGRIDLMDTLRAVSDVNHRTKDETTAFMRAANAGNARVLLHLMGWPEIQRWAADAEGRTALDWALDEPPEYRSEGELECARILSEAIPLEIAEGALDRVGAEQLPELLARVEAAKVRAAVSEGEKTKKTDEQGANPDSDTSGTEFNAGPAFSGANKSGRRL